MMCCLQAGNQEKPGPVQRPKTWRVDDVSPSLKVQNPGEDESSSSSKEQICHFFALWFYLSPQSIE